MFHSCIIYISSRKFTIDLLRPRSIQFSHFYTCCHASRTQLQFLPSRMPVPFPSCQWSCRLAVTLISNVHDKLEFINYWNCRYHKYQLSISTIGIIAFMYYWYRQLELWINNVRTMLIFDCQYKQCNCWYRQFIVTDVMRQRRDVRRLALLQINK